MYHLIPSCNSGLIRLWVCIFALNCSSIAPSINLLESTVGSAGMINFDASGITNVSTKPVIELPPPKLAPDRAQTTSTLTKTPGQNKHPFVNILEGDGGWTVFDPFDPLHVYGSSQNMVIYRHRRDNGWHWVTPEGATDEERGRIWMAIIAMHPHDPNIVFTGSTRVWRTNNDGVDWKPVSDDLDGSPITVLRSRTTTPTSFTWGRKKETSSRVRTAEIVGMTSAVSAIPNRWSGGGACTNDR